MAIPLSKDDIGIQCYLLNGEFTEKKVKDFNEIITRLEKDTIYNMPVELIIKLLAAYGKNIIKNKVLLRKEGVLYLATWLRESNLNNYVRISCNEKEYLDGFRKIDKKLYIRAQPRGLVCHWIAGNVPTLAVFSLIQSVMAKNTNIVRVPVEIVPGVIELLRPLRDVSVVHNGKNYTGNDLLRTISVVYFPSDNYDLNKNFSLNADCKVVWGGKEAVESILALPQKEHCESIVFGPKYSFSVVDEKSVNSNPDLFKRIVMDIILFEQNACSSSHVIFYELNKSDISRKAKLAEAKNFSSKLGNAFEELSRRYPKRINMYFSDILNARGKYLLDPDKDLVTSRELDWTVLIDDELQLEEPIKSRTVFVKPIDSVFDVIPLITHKIQTVGFALSNHDKVREFCEKATYSGVSRCVPVGTMNDYDTPWDGLFFIDRLVRWALMRVNKD